MTTINVLTKQELEDLKKKEREEFDKLWPGNCVVCGKQDVKRFCQGCQREFCDECIIPHSKRVYEAHMKD